MTSFVRTRLIIGAATLGMAMLLPPSAAQAACDGGDCPITGGSLKTIVGGGFAIPQTPFNFPFTQPAFPTEGGGIGGGFPPGGARIPKSVSLPMGFGNTAMGAVLPTASAMINVPSGQTAAPYSFTVPIGQMTYGSNSVTTPPLSLTPGQYFGKRRWATPLLVQVPLFNFAPALMGVSTNIGQSFPGDVRTFMNGTSTQVFGGPMQMRAGGRPGAATLTVCPGNLVPASIPATWTGSCNGFTPLTPSGLTGTQVAPVLARYTATRNQFGGPGTQRQVERLGDMGSQTWIGRINFNNFVAPYTAADMANTSTRKVYPTLPQNLVEPVVWGASFGQFVQRLGANPGNMVSALLTTGGKPQNTTTVMITSEGEGQGLVQTSTSWGGPLTTGMITVQVIPAMGTPSTFTETGNDQRTAGGEGMVSLVSGSMSSRTLSGPGTNRTMVTLQLPEPSMALGLIAGIAGLAAVTRRRGH